MKIYGFCDKCKVKHFFVRRRKFDPTYINPEGKKVLAPTGTITSQGELCRKCAKDIKKMIV